MPVRLLTAVISLIHESQFLSTDGRKWATDIVATTIIAHDRSTWPLSEFPRISELPPPALVRCLKEPPFLPPTRTIKGMAYDDLAKST
ncbi:hypothetical protein BO83DRAFT_374799 [Aspergillus eucalypticola CBS 122712]|uniref:Uncharacterized protein n=1 Tax=Aspergillus eucalypticola (strain CBS 122712 / IBT 29274) TaxID=1448314 RepID=A0A317WAD9_ASPEC|nr:uncharacterized protein BO83DRAFT_374799 [Aspergillus eucalypticola CBS 122712]PWY82277.1 hypothetical protein BO83DRAFT_374799 [Aspergillus eucalypticola CBS 122712]